MVLRGCNYNFRVAIIFAATESTTSNAVRMIDSILVVILEYRSLFWRCATLYLVLLGVAAFGHDGLPKRTSDVISSNEIQILEKE